MKKSLSLLLILISFIGFGPLALAQPDFKWDLELDVSIPFNVEGTEARKAHYGEYVPIIIEVKNCGPRLYDSGSLHIGIKIKLTVQGLELPSSNVNLGYGHTAYYADEQIIWVGHAENYCGPSVNNSYLHMPTIMAKVIDDENAYMTAEIVEYTHGGFYGIDDSNLSSYEIDSQPNNGVDTDGDGDFSNDPDDEDDGDGLYITDINTRKPISCSCEWESDEDTPTVNPEVVGSSAGDSGVLGNVSGGASGSNPTSPAGTNPSLPPGVSGSSSSGTIAATDGCMIAADVPSPFPVNPEDPNGIFKFDYFIESIARIGYTDQDGVLQSEELMMNYHVNSNDGSMFFATDEFGFFASNNIELSNISGRFDGVVWKADGQQVRYVYDNTTSTERAILVDVDQNAADVTDQKRANVRGFLNNLGSLTSSPDPLPSHLASKWGNVPGYRGLMNDINTGVSEVTIYMGKSPDVAPIPTNSPLVGFLAGIFKDNIIDNCNKLAVYTRMTTGPNKDFIEVELVNIHARDFEFDGAPYKITTLAAAPGTTHNRTMKDLEAEAVALSIQKSDLEKQKQANCASDDMACHNSYQAQMDALQDKVDELQCEALCLAGMEAALDDCNCN